MTPNPSAETGRPFGRDLNSNSLTDGGADAASSADPVSPAAPAGLGRTTSATLTVEKKPGERRLMLITGAGTPQESDEPDHAPASTDRAADLVLVGELARRAG
jgi:hypothetical protein